eukprot:m.333664 g.333664  ORF g.333664 m.333664 type:complete len:685 (+) comp17191_c0_seq1:129-2183(+)
MWTKISLLCIVAVLVQGNKLHEDVYTPLSVNAVSRLLDVDGMIGAQTREKGNVGVLYKIDSEEDLENFKKAPSRSYVAYVNPNMFAYSKDNQRFLAILQDIGVEGVLVYHSEDSPLPFSAGDLIPNEKYGIPMESGAPKWNSAYGGGFGDDKNLGMHWIDINFPIFALNEEDTKTVDKMFDEYNSPGNQNGAKYPMVGVKLEFFMWAAPDAETCMRRQFCDPLGSQSVFGFLRPYQTGDDVVILSAASDAVAMFHDNSYGADGQGAAIVATIAAASVIGQVPMADRENKEIFDKNIMISLFGGEHFGYIGSTAFGFKLKQGTAPSRDGYMNEENIKYYIELDQLVLDSPDFDYIIHTNKSADSIQDALNTYGTTESLTFSSSSVSGIMPPSSYRGLFYEADQARETAEAVVISKYNNAYTNSYFQTRVDNGKNMGVTNVTEDDTVVSTLCKLATTVAQTSLKLALVDGSDYDVTQFTANCSYVKELLQVIMVNQSLAAGMIRENFLPGGVPINRYVGVFSPGALNVFNYYAFYQLAASLAGETKTLSGDDKKECKYAGDARTGTFGGYDYSGSSTWNPITYTINDTHIYCFNSSVAWMDALSPAFNADMSFASRREGKRWSTWTESNWYAGAIDVFLMSNPAQDKAALGGGIAYFIFSFVFVFFFRRNVEFKSAETPSEVARPM